MRGSGLLRDQDKSLHATTLIAFGIAKSYYYQTGNTKII